MARTSADKLSVEQTKYLQLINIRKSGYAIFMAFWFDEDGDTVEDPCSQILNLDHLFERTRPFTPVLETCLVGSLSTIERHKLVMRFKKPGKKTHFLSLTDVGKTFVEKLFQSRWKDILQSESNVQGARNQPDIRYVKNRMKELEKTKQKLPSINSPSTNARPNPRKIKRKIKKVEPKSPSQTNTKTTNNLATVTPPGSNRR
jgi:hypothetical protein